MISQTWVKATPPITNLRIGTSILCNWVLTLPKNWSLTKVRMYCTTTVSAKYRGWESLAFLPEAPHHTCNQVGVGMDRRSIDGVQYPGDWQLSDQFTVTSDWVLYVALQNLARCSYSLSDTRVVTWCIVVNLISRCYYIIVQVNQSQLTAACTPNQDNHRIWGWVQKQATRSCICGRVKFMQLHWVNKTLYCSGAVGHPVSLIKPRVS